MFPEFKNLKDVMKNFSDDKTCRSFLEMKRWNGTPTCPHCSNTKSYKLNDGKTYKCGNKECRKKYTVTVGTIFENTNIPLSTWFAACYIITAHKKGISSVQLAKDLGITQKSSWFMIHRVREMLIDKHPEVLEGTVEADETYLGRKYRSDYQGLSEEEIAYKLNHSKENKGAVLGMAERSTGKVIVKAFDRNNRDNITASVRENVKTGSKLHTDESSLYRALEGDYFRETVVHGRKEWVRKSHVAGKVHTNNIENFWGVMKRGVYGTYHQISFKHLQAYCNEFSYRYNSRDLKDNERFEVTLSNIEGRLTYKTLIGK